MPLKFKALFFNEKLGCLKFHFKMLKNHQDFAFFVDPFKFEPYENLKRIDVRNLAFIISAHPFVLDLCNMKSYFTRFSVA